MARLVLTGTGGAPARSAFDPIRTWSWAKANDATGEAFVGQQFTWLFSTAFLRNPEAVQQTITLLASNPNPMTPEAYANGKPRPISSSTRSIGWAASRRRPWSSSGSRTC